MLSYLLSPNILSFLSGILGVYAGFSYPEIIPYCSPISMIYLSLLQVTVIPLIILSLILGVSHLEELDRQPRILSRTFLYISGLLAFASIWGILSSSMFDPGKEFADSPKIHDILQKTSLSFVKDLSMDEELQKDEGSSLSVFLTESFPKNIFNSLSTNNILQIVIFSLILGFGLNGVRLFEKNLFYKNLEILFHGVQNICSQLIVFLPIAIFFLMVDQTKNIDFETLVSMFHFVLVCFIAFFIMIILATLIIFFKSGFFSYTEAIKPLRNSMAIALSTRNSFIAMGYASTALIKRLNYPETNVNLLMPFSITIARYGNVFYFAFCIVFVANLYAFPFSVWHYILLTIGSILAGITTSGTSGFITLNMMSIAADPLGLPISGIIILFIAIDPLIDPLRTLANVVFSILAVCLISKRDRQIFDIYDERGDFL